MNSCKKQLTIFRIMIPYIYRAGENVENEVEHPGSLFLTLGSSQRDVINPVFRFKSWAAC
jgi:hypothetical protein